VACIPRHAAASGKGKHKIFVYIAKLDTSMDSIAKFIESPIELVLIRHRVDFGFGQFEIWPEGLIPFSNLPMGDSFELKVCFVSLAGGHKVVELGDGYLILPEPIDVSQKEVCWDPTCHGIKSELLPMLRYGFDN